MATCPGVTKTAAFRSPNSVGFCPVSRTYPMTTMSTISGLNPTACCLAPSGFGLPLPGLPADFAIDLLAKLWPSGTLTVCDHPLGNNIEFHGISSIPNDLDLPWREWISCLFRKFGEPENLLDVLMQSTILPNCRFRQITMPP